MIQLGLLGTDPNWEKHSHKPHVPRGITRRFILAMAVMVVALILIGLPFIQLGLALIGPVPLSYENVPFPVCSPRDHSVCLPLDGETFQPGDVVPLLATRCINNIFGGDDLYPYHVDRNLVTVPTNVRIILPDLGSAGPNGCTTSISLTTALPIAVAPGEYYLEGISTAYGRFRTVNAYWRSQSFMVRAPD